uniref:Uncharacterized protein n=1 Tax=Cucumis melo TaxID=3656 RepID=A0A9I9EE08_CUCME
MDASIWGRGSLSLRGSDHSSPSTIVLLGKACLFDPLSIFHLFPGWNNPRRAKECSGTYMIELVVSHLPWDSYRFGRTKVQVIGPEARSETTVQEYINEITRLKTIGFEKARLRRRREGRSHSTERKDSCPRKPEIQSESVSNL